MSSQNKNSNSTEYCYKCGHTYDKNELKEYRIEGRTIGSAFMYVNASIHLCEECQQFVSDEWFDNEETRNRDKYGDIYYNYEEDLQDEINTYPLEFQEKIYNQGFPEGFRIGTKDWIEQQMNVERLLSRREMSDAEVNMYKEYYKDYNESCTDYTL